MTTKRALMLAILVTASGCGFERTTKEDFESELTDSLADSLRAVSDASEVGTLGPSFGVDQVCTGVPVVNAFAPLCAGDYPSDVTVTWSCIKPDGNGASGTAEVDTLLVADGCPLTAATELTTTQSMTLGRQWLLGKIAATLSGTAALSWTNDFGQPARSKSITIDLDHKVSRREEELRHQHVTGTRTVTLDENGEGDADDTRVVDGTIDIDFLLADVHAAIGETDLTFRRGCCHPISGTLTYTLSGSEDRAGSIIFGPTCGAAETDSGRVLDLAPCVVD